MLTKSKFRNFLDCQNEFWLDQHFPEPRGELSLQEQYRREAGNEVERLARTLRPFVYPDHRTVEFRRVFRTEKLFAETDIVVSDPTTGEIEIYEVKSGTKAKPEYLVDLAFQCHVAEQSGFHVRKAFLITVDSSYVFDEVLEADKLLSITDATDDVAAKKDEVADGIKAALGRIQNEPIPALVDYCKKNKLECRFLLKHFPNIPKYNIANVFSVGKKLNELLKKGILQIRDIPADFSLTEREARVVDVERSGQPFIDKVAIREKLADLKYPLNFLDYESFGHAVPIFPNTYAYQPMAFQYSLHTIDESGGEVRHAGHLSRNDGRHPAEEVVERLHADLAGRVGTVLVWSQGFETRLNRESGHMFPKFANFFEEVNASIFDLRKIFSEHLYLHPEFRGRDSIKKVLPVLCPHLSYEELGIGDGLTASIRWYHMVTGRGEAADREKTYRDLCEYCKLDTEAMVEIYKVLAAI